MSQYKVLRSLNNNVVLTEYKEKFYIIIEKGIGFGKQYGDFVGKSSKAHYYLLRDENNLSAYEKVLLETDETILFATERAIRFAEKSLKHKFNESLHLSLLDHLNFAIYRHQNDLKLGSFFSEEYRYIYPELYDVAGEMIKILNEDLSLNLPEEEISAIVLHLHASLRDESISERAYYNQIIQESIRFISSELGEDLSKSKLLLVRLVTHLRFALERERTGQKLDSKMTSFIQSHYQKSYQLAFNLCRHLSASYQIDLPQEEIAYLALHIENIRKDKKGETSCLKNYKE